MAATKQIMFSNKSVFYFFLLSCCIIQVILCGFVADLLFAAQIAGSIYLPCGQTAPLGGIRVNINLMDQNSHYQHIIVAVTIPTGSSSQPYSATLPDDPSSSWLVNYYYWGKDYVQYAYYSSSGTTWKYPEATSLPGGQDHANINLTLLTGKTIAGIISLPSGRVSPPGGIGFSVKAEDLSPLTGNTWIFCFLQAGLTSTPYHLTVPDDTGLQFRISYIYYGTDYIPTGYYSSSGTKKDSTDATILPGGLNYSGISMTVLPKFPWPMFLPAIVR